MTNPDDLIKRSDVTDVIDGWKSFRFSSRVMIDAINSIPAARSDKGEAVYQIVAVSNDEYFDVSKTTYDAFSGVKRILFTAPQQAIPAGYAIVPIEPTQQMLNEAVLISSCDRHTGRKIDDLHSIFYKAMLSAAPTASIDNGVNDGTDK
jgi:hypothetical protein